MKNKHMTNKGISQSVSNCFKLSIKINTCNTATLFPLAMLTQHNFYCSMKLCYETSLRSYCSLSLRHSFAFVVIGGSFFRLHDKRNAFQWCNWNVESLYLFCNRQLRIIFDKIGYVNVCFIYTQWDAFMSLLQV